MAIVKKISELTPKGSALANTDLLIVGVDNGTDYDLKSVTGAQVLGNVVSQTITDGVTTKAPSENAVFDAFTLKVDKVTGSRLITSAEATILGNTSGTNTGDQNLQQVTDNGSTTTNPMYVNGTDVQAEILPNLIRSSNDFNKSATLTSDGRLLLNTNGTNTCDLRALTTTGNIVLDFPNKATGFYTIATTSDLSNQVPYTGATQNVDLGEYELKAGQLTLDITPTGTAAVGTTRWNDSLGTSETTLKGGSVIIKNGVDLVARVVNKVTPNTTLTKANYQVVRISGAQGQRLAVNLAQANNDNNSADTLGIVCETIATNEEGFIMTMGQLENVNTTGSLQSETWLDGDVLYLSPTTAGKITNVKPTGATGHIVILGYVEYAHAVNGKIYVKIMNGWELDELHNVSISGVLDKQLLSYDNATSLWKNKSVTTADIADSTNKRYVTDANLTTIDNTSGTNTGDETVTTIKTKLGITTLSGSNTGDQDLSGLMVKSNNLSDLTNTTTARTNLGLGSLATQSGTFSGTSSGTNTGDQIISDATLTTTDITTNNVSTTKHGFVPKAPNNTTQFLRGDGTWGTPASGGLTYFTEAQSTASPNATVNVDSLTAVASTTNADFAIKPKGSGAILRDIPDGATNGNKRGTYSVDFGATRSQVTNVASGTYSSILNGNEVKASGSYSSNLGGYIVYVTGDYAGAGGTNNFIGGTGSFSWGSTNTTTAAFCTALGSGHTLSQDNCFAGGAGHTISSYYSTAFGNGNTASGLANLVIGAGANSFGLNMRNVRGGYKYTTSGDNQSSDLILSARTTSATPKVLCSADAPYLVGASSANQMTLQDNSMMRIKGSISGKQQGSTNVGVWDFDCVIVRGANAGTTTIANSNVNLVVNTGSFGTPTITANTTIGSLAITVTGVATTNIQWQAILLTSEIIYA